MVKGYCAWCDEAFRKTTDTKIYCSSKCRAVAKRERNRSPIKQVITALEKVDSRPVSQNCPICNSISGFTDANIAVCPNGHQWAIIGDWQQGYSLHAKETYHILENRFKKTLKAT